MKLLHLADLHIGKMLYGYSLIDDQQYLFESIYETIHKEAIDLVMIAGDVYDRAIPSVEAVNLLNEFLERLVNECQVKVLLISGNHDSASRLNFGSGILEKKGLHIVTEITEQLKKVTYQDDEGDVNFYMLPYFTKSELKAVLDIEDKHISLDGLMKEYMARQGFDFSQRNVLVGHLTCIGGMGVDDVAGLEWVSPQCFDGLDYVALGHLHACHRVNQKEIYYAGSPLRLSIDEAKQKKGLMMIDLRDKGMVRVETLPIVAKRDLIVKEGYLNDLLAEPKNDEYVFLTLLDETLQVNAADRARDVYSHLLGLSYKKLNALPKSKLHHELKHMATLSPLALFTSFYEELMDTPMSEETKILFKQYFEKEDTNEN